MFLFNQKFTKIISLFLVLTFLVPSLLFIKPKKTEAIFADWIGGSSGIISATYDAVSIGYDAIVSAASWAMKNKEFVLDTIAWNIAKMAIQQMVNETVNWINSGFEGNPAFVTDFGGMMTEVADGVIGDYIYGTQLDFLCSPFSLDLKLSLYNSFYGGGDAPKCTLSEAIENAGGALQSLEDDFRWGTWLEMTNEPSNNPIGSYLIIKSNILAEINAAEDETEIKASWGKGFISWEECDDVEECTSSGCRKTEENCSILTPGSVIADSLNKQMGAGQDTLVTADEFNEIISALLMQLVSEVMSQTGLAGSSTSDSDWTNTDNISNTSTNSMQDQLDQEQEYNNAKNDSLNLVMQAKNILVNLIDCLQITNEDEKLEKAEKIRDNEITIPQSDFKINLGNLETNIRSELDISGNTIISLNDLINRVNTTDTNEDLTSIMSEYQNLLSDIHSLIDISDAIIERDGYGTIVDGLANGLTYDIPLLINTYADNISRRNWDIYPLEDDKGLQQRYDECQTCQSTGICTEEGAVVPGSTGTGGGGNN